MKSLKEAAGCHTRQKADTGSTLLQNHLWEEVREVQGAEKASDGQVPLTTLHCRNQGSCQEPQHSRTEKEGPFLFQWDCSSNIKTQH